MADTDIKKIPVASANPFPVNTGAADDDANDGDPFADIKKELSTRFELLPEDLKKVITDDKYQVQLFDIGKEKGLNFEELGSLEMETTMVLLGMIPPTQYRDELQVQLKKNDAEVDALVAMVNEKIFTPIRTALEKLYVNKKDPAEIISADVLNEPTPKEPTPVFPPSMDVKTSPNGVAGNSVGVPSPAMNIAGMPIAPAPAPQGNFIAAKPIAMPTAAPMPAPAPSPTLVPTMQGGILTMQKPATASGLSTQEKSLLEKTGVVISETPTPVPSAPLGSRSDMLASIENPTKTPISAAPMPSSSMVASKLQTAAPAMPATKTTDYTLPKVQSAAPATPAPTAGGADPYREPIN